MLFTDFLLTFLLLICVWPVVWDHSFFGLAYPLKKGKSGALPPSGLFPTMEIFLFNPIRNPNHTNLDEGEKCLYHIFVVVVPNIKVMFCCLAIDKGFFTHYSVLMESVFTNRWSIGEKAIIWGSHHHGLYEVLSRVNCRWIQTLYNLYEIRGPIASIANSLKSSFFSKFS